MPAGRCVPTSPATPCSAATWSEPIYQPRWDVDAPGVAEATLDELVAQPVAKLLARHESLSREDFVARFARDAAPGDLRLVDRGQTIPLTS